MANEFSILYFNCDTSSNKFYNPLTGGRLTSAYLPILHPKDERDFEVHFANFNIPLGTVIEVYTDRDRNPDPATSPIAGYGQDIVRVDATTIQFRLNCNSARMSEVCKSKPIFNAFIQFRFTKPNDEVVSFIDTIRYEGVVEGVASEVPPEGTVTPSQMNNAIDAKVSGHDQSADVHESVLQKVGFWGDHVTKASIPTQIMSRAVYTTLDPEERVPGDIYIIVEPIPGTTTAAPTTTTTTPAP